MNVQYRTVAGMGCGGELSNNSESRCCGGLVAENTQEALDNLSSDCMSFSDVWLFGPLVISNYQSSNLSLGGDNITSTTTLYVDRGINISNSKQLQTLETVSIFSEGANQSPDSTYAGLILEDLPRLTKIKPYEFTDYSLSNLTLRRLPALETIGLGENSSGQISVSSGSIAIEDTGLKNFPTITAGSYATDDAHYSSVTVANNSNLGNISLPCKTVDDVVFIQGSPVNISLSSLTRCGGIHLEDISGLSLELLQNISGHFHISNAAIPSFSLPVLENISGNLTLTNLTQLSQFSFGSLLSVGGTVNITANPGMSHMGGLNALEHINGSLYIDGPLSSWVSLYTLRVHSADLNGSQDRFTNTSPRGWPGARPVQYGPRLLDRRFRKLRRGRRQQFEVHKHKGDHTTADVQYQHHESHSECANTLQH